MRQLLSCLLFAAALLAGPAATAEMSAAEREAFRAEVRAYLLENPEILSEMVALLEARQLEATSTEDAARVAQNAEALFEDGFSFVGGNPGGSLTVVEFLDYQCGYCRAAHPEIQALVAEDGDIRWIVKELPILGPVSETAARAAIAAMIQGGPAAYAAVNDALMRIEGPLSEPGLDTALEDAGLDPATIRAAMQDAEVTRRIEATRALAKTLEIQGTPTFVLGETMLRGYVPMAAMRDLVDEIRTVN